MRSKLVSIATQLTLPGARRFLKKKHNIKKCHHSFYVTTHFFAKPYASIITSCRNSCKVFIKYVEECHQWKERTKQANTFSDQKMTSNGDVETKAGIKCCVD